MKPLYSSHAHFCSPYGPLLLQGLIEGQGMEGSGLGFCTIYSFVV